ncbi:MAG TPA: BTAD domain-containing putative transcriptional regulator [Streptosporangiaceae bacterium]|nr:BTAD domain-containing putative transcriptional regulator [Streptosporangiaceae bacterium]
MPVASADAESAPGTGVRLRLLGPLAAWRDGRPVLLGPPRQRAVLAILAIESNAVVHRETIIDALWEQPPATAVNLVQVYVSRLRAALDPARSPQDQDGLLVSARTSYRLQVTADQLDLLGFRDLVRQARAALRAGDAAIASDLFTRALRAWKAEPLADLDVLRGHKATYGLARERVGTVLAYADTCRQHGHPERALDELWAATAVHPFHEPAHARLMTALAGSGEAAAALQIYEEIRRRLDHEFGVLPGAELAQAHALILRQDARLTTGAVLGGEPPDRLPDPAAAVARMPMPRQLPAALWPTVGRADELKQMSAHLSRMAEGSAAARGSAVITAIVGAAGVGKTTLAIQWAHQAASCFPDGQLYVDLGGFGPRGARVRATEALHGFLEALGMPAEHIPAHQKERAALYRTLLADRRMLVLADNARDVEEVRPLLPGGPGSLVIVTSRSQLAGLAAVHRAQLLILDVLSRQAARQLLASRLGRGRLSDEPDAAARLVETCGRLPLALSIAATLASAQRTFPLAFLTDKLRRGAGRLDILAGGDPATDLRTVFSWSYEALTEPGARLFRLLGRYPGRDVTVPVAARLAGVPLPVAHDLLRELSHVHLLTEHVPGRFAFHDLIREYAAGLEPAGRYGNGVSARLKRTNSASRQHASHGTECTGSPRAEPSAQA